MTPTVTLRTDGLVDVQGVFFRAVTDGVPPLSGSVSAGRYSRPGQPTLYMSASAEGVAAAMQAHPSARGTSRSVLSLKVSASRIADLRNPAVFDLISLSPDDAFGPWQHIVAQGGEPRSWAVRDALERIGARGLIDPSRTAPGLWHIVLFRWNEGDGATVRPLDG